MRNKILALLFVFAVSTQTLEAVDHPKYELVLRGMALHALYHFTIGPGVDTTYKQGLKPVGFLWMGFGVVLGVPDFIGFGISYCLFNGQIREIKKLIIGS